ncbi:MAG TPA: hypothetical protein VL983_10180 [Terriglobales bacterium]|nr:hypothetical protein [Terriglobales bacterium]
MTFLAYIVWAIVIFVALAGLSAPILIDARHWWPRRRSKKM